jgi:uncharacterized protein YciI
MAGRCRILCLLLLCAAGGWYAAAHAQPPAASTTDASSRLYAVTFRTGRAWDAGKPAHEQAHFREHSANLRKLREQGSLVVGARYGETGLIVLLAPSEPAARAMIEQDPTVQNGVFAFELHELSVFYGGTLQPPPRGRP